MKKILGVLLFLIFVSAEAASVGADASTPGYSAADVYAQSGYTAPNGIYWIDPDLPGGDSPFRVFADMTTGGGCPVITTRCTWCSSASTSLFRNTSPGYTT